MINLLFITNVFDNHLRCLITALKSLDFHCILHPLNNQKFPNETTDWFDSVEPDLIKASNSSQLILITVDCKESIDSLLQLDISGHRNKLIVDIARNSLKAIGETERSVRVFLKQHKPYVIARDNSQMVDLDGESIDCEAVVSQDCLKFSYLPRPLIADIAWFLQKRNGNELIPQPPSTYIDDLISAPIGDENSNILADKILQIDKFFSYALFRKELNGIITNDTIPQVLKTAAYHDNFFWNSSLALLHHLPENSHIAKDLLKLKSHLTPKRPSNNGKAKKRILLFVVKKQRDLFIDLILRYWLEKLGHEVIMRSLDNIPENSILELLPDAIIWGAKTTLYQMHLARFAADRNIISIVRREESLSYKDWNAGNPTVKSWYSGLLDYSPFVDLELFFGEEYAEIISTHGHMPGNGCKAVGAMCMDPYFIPNLQYVFPSKAEFCKMLGICPSKKTMLFASRWGLADREPSGAIPEAIDSSGQTTDSSPDVIKAVNMEKDGRKQWLESIRRLYNNEGDKWNIIIKVHPGEKREGYESFFHENNMCIPVIIDDYMIKILNNIDLLIHAGSTTAIEAHLRNIPSISFYPTGNKYSPVRKLSPVAMNFDELSALISNIRLGYSNANIEAAHKSITNFYGTLDGNACQRAAHVIDLLLMKKDTCPFRYPNDKFKTGITKVDDPYGQNVTQEDIDNYYHKVKKCLHNGK